MLPNIINLTGLLFGQDVLTLENGEQFKGKYLGNDAKQVAEVPKTLELVENVQDLMYSDDKRLM